MSFDYNAAAIAASFQGAKDLQATNVTNVNNGISSTINIHKNGAGWMGEEGVGFFDCPTLQKSFA